MPPRRARKNNERPQPVDPLGDTVSYAEYQAVFQALAQAVTANAQDNVQAAVPPPQEGNSVAAQFLAGVSGYDVKEYRSSMLNRDMDLSRLMIHAQQIEADKSQNRSLVPVPSSASAPLFRIRQEQGNRSTMSRSQDSVSNKPHSPLYLKSGRDHPGECLVDRRGCFGCGNLGHRFRDCPYAK
ncbi:uncharacterized protein LOC124898037 [Capsicum annuum]|uniref:uncharacterized protein LOC124898037 n=1 Tax=Capsicum annuum TaxID=4072 RepID=UPI001FB143F6|nr:uncharacterized protein LOC124898037 [Capsicum annuum]